MHLTSLTAITLQAICTVLLLQGLIPAVASASDATPVRPNILFLLVNDQRNDTLGCAGHPIVKTPVIDRLASEGMRFANAFATTPICAASRASIFTGLYTRTHGYTFGKKSLRPDHMAASYPARLRKAGYRTGFIGYYGVKTQGSPESGMFDIFDQIASGPFFKKQADGSLRHETEIAGDKAIAFLKAQPDGTPFCLSISFQAAHAADWDHDNHFPSPIAVDGLYEDVEIPAPRLSDPQIFENHPDFLKHSMNRDRFFWRWDTPEKYQKNMRAYFRMISGVDRVIGRIQRALEDEGLSENTVVFYMADHGFFMGDRGFAGKWSHYEESLRVPLIIYDPRLPPRNRGVVANHMALNIDVSATMLELAGLERPAHYEGRSLLPLLQGKDVKDWRRDFFCEHSVQHPRIPKWEGVRGERFVYARYFDQQPVFEFLHDLQTDPDQLANLASHPDYQEELVRLRDRCAEFAKRE